MVDAVIPARARAFATCREAQEAVVAHLRAAARTALRARGRFLLALSGGATPGPVFARLGHGPDPVDWGRVHLAWVDERAVPPSDPRSNFGSAWRHGIADLPVPPAQIHRIHGEERLLSVARNRYERDLSDLFGGPPAGPGRGFDAVLLGIGPDGHTASLFPGAASLSAEGRWTVEEPNPAQEPRVPRISLTLPALRSAAQRIFLVCGAEKRPILDRIRAPSPGTALLPAATVGAMAPSYWFVDAAAAPEG